jgi:hypothetical protein
MAPITAAAQQADDADEQQTPQNRGPMIVERVHSGFLVAPDAKVTRVDGKTSEFAGAYAGWLNDDRFFIGGGAYVLANGSHDREMAYGGLVVQWMGGRDQTIGWSLKGLFGGGEATLTDSFAELVAVSPLPAAGSKTPITFSSQLVPFRFRQDFLVAEPEAHLLVRLGRNVHLTVGAGYRAIGIDRRDGGGDADRLRGATGSIGVQIGGGGS